MEVPEVCPRFERAVDILSKRWTTLILHQLLPGPQRFAAIEGSLRNLSGKVLSDRLKELEEEGIVTRTVYPEKPVRIEYSLTAKGAELAPILDQIQHWATRWIQLSPEEDRLPS